MKCVLVQFIILCFTFHMCNIANFLSSAVINFNVKLKIYLNMHGSVIFFLVFVVSAYNTKCKKKNSWLFTLAQLKMFHVCVKKQISSVCS